MDLIKFLKDNGKFLKLTPIEDYCNIPSSTLRSVVIGRRNLSENHCISLIDFFSRFGVELTYKIEDGRSPTRGYELLPSNWIKTVSGKYRSPDGRKEEAVIIDGELMVKI